MRQSRRGRKQFSYYLDPVLMLEVKELATQKRMPMWDLIEQLLDAGLREHGLSRESRTLHTHKNHSYY